MWYRNLKISLCSLLLPLGCLWMINEQMLNCRDHYCSFLPSLLSFLPHPSFYTPIPSGMQWITLYELVFLSTHCAVKTQQKRSVFLYFELKWCSCYDVMSIKYPRRFAEVAIKISLLHEEFYAEKLVSTTIFIVHYLQKIYRNVQQFMHIKMHAWIHILFNNSNTNLIIFTFEKFSKYKCLK